jgi:hypothetical protein
MSNDTTQSMPTAPTSRSAQRADAMIAWFRGPGEATGTSFRLFRLGGLGAFGTLIKVVRALSPQNEEVFPPWQGMQYLHNMASGLPKLDPLDNARYPDIRWTPVRDVLRAR